MNEITFTIVESPLRGHPDGYEAGLAYARCCLRHAISLGDTPWMSHLLYTQALNDTIPQDRSKGLELHMNIIKLALFMPVARMAIYADYGISEGMQEAIDYAHHLQITVTERFILPESVRKHD